MTDLLVPYHQDEHLPTLAADLPPGWSHTTVTASLPPTESGWARQAPLYAAVAEAVASEQPAVVVSGCCCVSLGVLAGLQRRGIDAGVLWFDAHGDVQTMETTTSGYLGGMPLRMMLGYRPELVADAIGLRAIAEEQAVLVGARDLDPPERSYLSTVRVGQTTVDDLDPDAVAGPLLLHIDVDIVDSGELAGLRFPTPAGPSAERVVAAVQRVLATGRVAALDIACTWDPAPTDPAPNPATDPAATDPAPTNPAPTNPAARRALLAALLDLGTRWS